jgi:hypothetical protein
MYWRNSRGRRLARPVRSAARRLGDCLVVCLNSDRSSATLKGPTGR